MKNFLEIKDILDMYVKCIKTLTERVVVLEARIVELEENIDKGDK